MSEGAETKFMSQSRAEKTREKEGDGGVRAAQRNVCVRVCVRPSGGEIREAISDCPSMSQRLCPL